MPRYFSEKGKSHEEVIGKIRRKYGDRARIMMHKNVPMAGLLGLLGKEQVEITGYVAVGEEGRKVQKTADDQNRAAILAAAGRDLNAMTVETALTTGVGSAAGDADARRGTAVW